MSAKLAMVPILFTGMAAGQAVILDCTNNPTCPQGKACQCIKGTWHPEPSFLVDERGDIYSFTINLENHIGWTCEQTSHGKDEVTVRCARAAAPGAKGKR